MQFWVPIAQTLVFVIATVGQEVMFATPLCSEEPADKCTIPLKFKV